MKTCVLTFLLATALLAHGAASNPPPTPSVAPGPLNPTGQTLETSIDEALKAMHSATKGTLFSLEPSGARSASGPQSLYGNTILGQMDLDPKQLATTVAEFQGALDKQAVIDAANPGSFSMGMCDNPRHALKVTVDGHTYEFLLCFECGHFNIYKDGQHIADLNATGTPWVLNDLLTANKIALSKSGMKKDEYDAIQKKTADIENRWLQAMPKSLQPFWEPLRIMDPDITPMRDPLAKEFPDVTQRIRALLSWYGSGSTDWVNVPTYEHAAMDLLRDYTTAELVTAIQSSPLSEVQLNGAARAFTSYTKPDPAASRPARGTPPQSQYDFSAIPAPLKAALLEHVLKSNNRYNIQFAQWAFSPPPPDNTTSGPVPAK